MLEWVREGGCPWDKEECYLAVENGHLGILKYAIENNCPWDKFVYRCEIKTSS